MKVMNRLKIVGMVGMVALVFAACGSSPAITDPRGNTPYTCDGTGTNVYTGTIVSCTDAGGCMYGEVPVTGSVVLSILPMGGTMNGQFTGSASLTVNGNTYCCTSQGVSGTLGYPTFTGVDATVDNLTLACQPTSTGTGLFSGGYNTVALRIGVNVTYAFPTALLTTDKRLKGWIQISGFAGINNSNPTLFVH